MKKGYFHQKLEALNKGLKGDWQSEGYTLHHQEINRDHLSPGGLGSMRTLITAKDKNGQYAGHLDIDSHQQKDGSLNHLPSIVRVADAHKRKGIASAMYKLAEEKLGGKIMPSSFQSKNAEDLWSQPNRNFGKSENKIIKGENMDTPKPVTTPVEETPSQKYFKDKIKQIKDKFNAEQEIKAGETWKNNIKAAGVDARAKMSKSEPPKEPPTLNYATMENSSYKPWHWKEKLAASKRNAGTPKTAVPATAPAPLATTPKPRSFRDYANGIKKSQLEKEEMTNKLKGGKADGKKISDFDPKALKEGAEHEKEHTKDKDVAKEIAADHLSESKSYYKKLKRLT